ncbi:hypothetical protein RB195_017412 [Necator americanus]|uniref:Uncharacterized protein n=1 Tax=Necator americanus TaxID=51031 RepID=A0ABR1C7K8_NECAM
MHATIFAYKSSICIRKLVAIKKAVGRKLDYEVRRNEAGVCDQGGTIAIFTRTGAMRDVQNRPIIDRSLRTDQQRHCIPGLWDHMTPMQRVSRVYLAKMHLE